MSWARSRKARLSSSGRPMHEVDGGPGKNQHELTRALPFERATSTRLTTPRPNATLSRA